MPGLPSFTELLESAFGDGYKAVLVALVVGYLLAACVVFRVPSPFRPGRFTPAKKNGKAGGGGSEKNQEREEEADGVGGAVDDGDDGYPSPMRKGDLTVGELRRHDGTNASLPVLVAAKGKVFDVTRGRDFYGKEGGPFFLSSLSFHHLLPKRTRHSMAIAVITNH
jgi:hypothetical protein